MLELSFQHKFYFPVYFTENVFKPSNNTLLKALRIYRGENYENTQFLVCIENSILQFNPKLKENCILYFKAHQLNVPIFLSLNGGEECKNSLEPALIVAEATHLHGIDRHSYIIAIGGGAFLDMVGFAAAISHRGVRLIRVPTTVLAQNDSGVGVKNAINAFGKKNYLGTFTLPFGVINDADFLQSLDQRNWRAGIAEAVKVALIMNHDFFQQIQSKVKLLVNRDAETMQWLIQECAKTHIQHIAQGGDPFEQGSSRPLDYGHWVAHKLEFISNYEILHGEAVAAGMLVDAQYALLNNWLTLEEYQTIENLLLDLGFPLNYPQYFLEQENISQLLNGLTEFAQHLGGELTITMLNGIGESFNIHHVEEKLMLRALKNTLFKPALKAY